MQLGRSSVELDPTSTIGQTVSVQESRETEIRSIAEILTSRALAEKVVDQVGVEKILASTLPSWLQLPKLDGLFSNTEAGSDPANPLVAERSSAEIKRRELAVKAIIGALKVEPGKKSTVISISCEAQTPYLAQELVKTLITIYEDEHVRLNRTEGSLKFFEEKYKEEENKVVVAAEAIRTFKLEKGFTTISGHQQLLEREIDKLDLDLIDTEASIREAEAKLNKITQLLDEHDASLVSEETEGVENETFAAVRASLYLQELDYQRLLASYSEAHPLVKRKKQEIEKSTKILQSIPAERQETKTVAHPNSIALKLELANTTAALEGLQAKAKSLAENRSAARKSLEDLSEWELKMAELERAKDIAQTDLYAFAKKRAEASVIDQLDNAHISNVTVAQPASLILKAVFPKNSIVGLGGLMGSLMMTCLSAVYFDRKRIFPDLFGATRATPNANRGAASNGGTASNGGATASPAAVTETPDSTAPVMTFITRIPRLNERDIRGVEYLSLTKGSENRS